MTGAFLLNNYAIAGPVSTGVTERYSVAMANSSFNVVAEMSPNGDFNNRVDDGRYGLGQNGWYHDSIWSGQADMTFSFFEENTNDPFYLDSFAVKITDIDSYGHGLGDERFWVSEVDQVRVTPDSVLNINLVDASDRRINITSNGRINGSDKNAVILDFAGGSAFELEYETQWGYNVTNGGGISILSAGAGENFNTEAVPMLSTLSAETGGNSTTATVPAPSTVILLGIGVIGIVVASRPANGAGRYFTLVKSDQVNS